MIKWLKWAIARKEMQENQMWRIEWYMYDRWLCQFKDVELLLKNMKAHVDGRDALTLEQLREKMSELRNRKEPTKSGPPLAGRKYERYGK